MNHNSSQDAIFTTSIIQGSGDRYICSSPNSYHLFFGTARKVFHGDMVIAIDAQSLTSELKDILNKYHVIVYEVPTSLCSKDLRYYLQY